MRSRMRMRRRLLGTALALVLSNASTAAETPETPSSEEIIVTAEMFVRSRTDDVNPVLVYDRAYFERFEPVSVGEMLKRVSGVTFSSDILEYEGVELRGLPPGFTQILINGRRAPGGDADRSFFVDRIPAELVERIEIVRAPSADQPSEGVAGTLNIITRDSAAFTGGFAKVGTLVNGPDGKTRPSAAVAYAGTMGRASLWGALNYQGRRNPKTKVSDFFDGEFGAFSGRELQDDARDGADLSANAELSAPIGEGRLRLTGTLHRHRSRRGRDRPLVLGRRRRVARARNRRDRTRDASDSRLMRLAPTRAFLFRVAKSNWRRAGPGTVRIHCLKSALGTRFSKSRSAERETLDITDDEFSGTVAASFGPKELSLKVGADLLHKVRDGANREFEIDDGVEEETTRQGAIFSIEETRIDPYIQLIAEPVSGLSIDAGFVTR